MLINIIPTLLSVDSCLWVLFMFRVLLSILPGMLLELCYCMLDEAIVYSLFDTINSDDNLSNYSN